MIPLSEFFELRKNLPVVDVRSPLEFSQGHIAKAINIPLLNNEERVQVGKDYKQKGQAEAIKTGFRLVGPRLEQIINETEKIAQGRELLVHCWRGGMRSTNFRSFVGMARIHSKALKGGYKAYRQLAIETFSNPFQFILLGGFTGSGKSEILRALKNQGEQILDLEKLANHKGSAFGGLMLPNQPTTEQFQNNLFEEILKLDLSKRIWIEDESVSIGKIFLPQDFWNTMRASKIVVMDVSKEIRVQRLTNEYGVADKEEFLSAMTKITKRLGGQHFNAAKEKLLQGDMASTIEILLTYYDKTYGQSLENKKENVLYKVTWNGENPNQYALELIHSLNT